MLLAPSDVRAFADALPQLLWIARPDGALEFVNRALCAFTGRESEAFLGSAWVELLPPSERAKALAYWEGVRTAGVEAPITVRVAHAAGGYHTLQGRNVPVRDGGGGIAYWIGWCVDLDELRAGEEPFRMLADTIPALVFVADPADGRLTFVNRAWSEYTGGLGVGSTLEERNRLVYPDDRALLESALQRSPGIELRIRRASDGSYRWHAIRWRRVAAPDGTPLSRVGVLVDIDEQKRAAADQAYLSEVSRSINSSLDLAHTVRTVARLAVPTLADWCQVDLRDGDGVVTRALAHRDPSIEARLRELIGRRHESVQTQAYERLTEAIVQGRPVVARHVEPSAVDTLIADPRLRELYAIAGSSSSMILPLAVRGRRLGAISMVRVDAEHPYDDRDLSLGQEFARRAALAIDNAQIFGREHRVAEAMQSASLPKRLPKLPSVDMHAIYVPAHDEATIGGDWYDAFRLRDGRLVISIGDVAGSGVDAAVTMSNMRQVIRGTAQVHADPVLMLNAADRALRLEEGDLFVTAFVAVLDPIARTLVYANAGHPAPYVRTRDGAVRQLAFEDLPLGLRQKNASRPKLDRLEDGSMLIFYTDGLIESEHDVVGGIAALERTIASAEFYGSANPAKFLRGAVLGEGARDDVAILTLRLRLRERRNVPEGTSKLYRWRYEKIDPKSAQELRARFRRALLEHGLDDAAAERAELVLGELIGNIVRHAPGALEVIVDLSSANPVLHVIDEGPGFERSPMLPSDLLSESGRGLYIVSEMTDEFSVARGPHGGSHARVVLGH